jgi:hypothetical protein
LELMRSWVGYALAALSALLAAIGVFFVVAAGGNEPQAIRASGVYLLALAAAFGVAAALVLRSR